MSILEDSLSLWQFELSYAFFFLLLIFLSSQGFCMKCLELRHLEVLNRLGRFDRHDSCFPFLFNFLICSSMTLFESN